MKLRFPLVMLALLLLFTACTPPAAGETEFTFRNNITWGATMDQVQTAEGGEPRCDDNGPLDLLIYEQAAVSNYEAELMYIFLDDSLVIAYYYFEELPSHDYDYLAKALTSKYGEPMAADPVRQYTLMQVLDPGNYGVYKLTNWELNDGTLVALFSMDDDMEEQFALVYSDEQTVLQAGGLYNTNGL